MFRVRRLLGWAVFLGFLGAVGVGVFHFVRYRPRCTIPELLFVMHLSGDGSRLVTIKPPGNNQVHARTPVQVWDTHSGSLMREMFGEGPGWFEFSPDGRTMAAGLEDGTVWLADWQAGTQRQVDDLKLAPLPHRAPWPRHWFSPKGRWLFVGDEDKPGYVVNVATGKVAMRLKVKFFRFNADERFAFVHSGDKIEVWDLEALDKVAVLASESDWINMSPDGRSLVTRRTLPPPAPMHAAPVQGIDVWDLRTFKPRFHRELSPPGYWQADYAPDGRTLALWSFSDLAILDANTGRLLGAYTMEQCRVAGFSADGALWFSAHGPQFAERVTMFDAATGRVLWEKPGRCSFEFIGADRILHQERRKPPQLIDARSGEPRGTLPNAFAAAPTDLELWDSGGWIRDCKQTSDGRHFVFAGRQQRLHEARFWERWFAKWWPERFGDNVPGLVVMESATGRELLRLANAGNQSVWLRLSDNAGTLVTVDAFDDGRRLVRVWDVQPTRAWLWAVGVATATGSGLLALRWAWRRRKAL